MFKLIEVKINISCVSTNDKMFCYNTKQEELFLDEIKIDTIKVITNLFVLPEIGL